jgi:hypothetical protein
MFRYIHSFDGEIDAKAVKEDLEVVLDSNILIYLEKYFNNPLKFMQGLLINPQTSEIAYSIQELLQCIAEKRFIINEWLAVDESCRDAEGVFELDKAMRRIDVINLMREEIPASQLLNPKGSFENYLFSEEMRGIFKENLLQNPLFAQSINSEDMGLKISYLYSLKLYQLKNKQCSQSLKMMSFFHFMIEEIDIFSATHFIYAVMLFGELKQENGK